MFRRAFWFGVILRLAVAIWNGFFGPSYGADLDAVTFHRAAVDYASDLALRRPEIGFIYSDFLGLIYMLTTDSIFLGSLLSVVAWAASAIVLARTMRLLSISRWGQVEAMLIYALLPSSIIYTSVTLREAYEMLFINLAIYAALQIYRGVNWKYWPGFALAIAGVGVLHGALLAFGMLMVIALGTVMALRSCRVVSPSRVAMIAVAGLGLSLLGFWWFTSVSYNLRHSLPATVEIHRRATLAGARSEYIEGVSLNGMPALIAYLPVALFQYLFEPMPWHVSALVDLELVAENLLRAYLLWRIVKGLRYLPAERRSLVWVVVFFYLVLELIWSMGTVNWGTAARHHLPGLGLLLVAAYVHSRPSRRTWERGGEPARWAGREGHAL